MGAAVIFQDDHATLCIITTLLKCSASTCTHWHPFSRGHPKQPPSSPMPRNGTARIDVPSWRSWTDCATSVGSRYRLMLPVMTMTLDKCKTSEKQSEKSRKKMSVASTWFLFWGLSHCCPSNAPVVHFINTKRINNPLCYLTDQGCVPQKHRKIKYIVDPLKPMELRST